MHPIAIRSLGALAPKTDDGTIVAPQNAAPAAAEPFKNALRSSLRLFAVSLFAMTCVLDTQ